MDGETDFIDPTIKPQLHAALCETLEPKVGDCPDMDHRRISRLAARWIADRLGAGDHGAATIARDMGMSYYCLAERLRRERTSYRIILNEVRTQRVQLDLAKSQNVGDVAMQLGFRSREAFSRWFRSQFGGTPSETRRQVSAT